jgi:large subunit ribosomal protein L24
MKFKKGDLVKIMTGKDRGKEGKVIQIFPELNKLIVEGCNKRIKHLKPRKQREKGQKIEYDAPMNMSNAQLICNKCKKVTRVGYKKLENKEKVRICRKCKELI